MIQKDNNLREWVKDIAVTLESVPYDVAKDSLYDAASLYRGYDYTKPETFENCHDTLIYRHYLATGKIAQDEKELLARSLHDYAINKNMRRFLVQYNERRGVAVMGGHALSRTNEMYEQIARLSKKLTERGFIMISGGGPGAMEATHLGAWLAGHPDETIDESLKTLREFPTFKDEGWLASAFKVMRQFPKKDGYQSLGIPTWTYGHEPATPFATHIAKFFENSIREDNILTLAFGGIIYTPGSAGTMQEIFQDAVQNHYLSFDYASPMVFLGKKLWSKEVPIYPLLEKFMERGIYKNLKLALTDDLDEITEIFHHFYETGAKEIGDELLVDR